jgi:hypothetical protein
MNQQRAQILVTSLTDSKQLSLPAAPVLPRYKTQPGGHLLTVLKGAGIGNTRYQRTRR